MRRTLKVFASALLATTLVGSGLYASNIPLVTGPLDPSALVAHINALTYRINFGVSGLLASLTTAYTTTGTSPNVALQASLPPSQLAVGNELHYFASGVNSADANVKTVTFAYGATTCAVIVTGSGASWIAEAWLNVNAAATQELVCKGQQAATAITVNETAGTVNNAAAVAAEIELTAATSGTTEALVGYIEQVK